MADFLLVLNNITSGVLAVTCWWLAHNYAAAGRPLGRWISILLGIFSLSVLATAFARNVHLDPSPWLIVSKVVLTALFAAVARRVALRREHTSLH